MTIRKLISLCAVALLASSAQAQTDYPNWQNAAPTQTTFGADIEGMHSLGAGRKAGKKPVVVAIIGNGADIEHPALAGAWWTNRKEKADNHRDDDRNGWVDDVHGWNFLGPLEHISREGDREYLRLRGKYGDYFGVMGDKVYRYDTVNLTLMEVPMPADKREFEQFLLAQSESEIAQAFNGVRLAKVIVAHMERLDKELRAKYPDRKIGQTELAEYLNRPGLTPEVKYLNEMTIVMAMVTQSYDWDGMLHYARTQFANAQGTEYARAMQIRSPREDGVLGDGYDLTQRGYGNGLLKAENAPFGTMQAGLIAAHDNDHVSGAAPEAQIMVLRVDAGQQDEARVKDIALAIRYAVDKGAGVIQLGKSNTLYPYPYAAWVDEALKYAEQKGVVVVQPMLDMSYDIDELPFYPVRGELTNFITVAASDMAGSPFVASNYGRKGLDLFAPGVDVESTMIDGQYAEGSGSYLAASVVTGVAAYLRAYFPKLTPAQIREVLMASVTSREGAEVEKSFHLNGKVVTDLFLFDDLCASGGILNARAAFVKAATM